MDKKEVTVNAKVKGLDEALEKAQKYHDLLKEAKTLADELASVDFEVSLQSQR